MTTTITETPLALWMRQRGISADALARVLGYNAIYIQQIAMGYRPITDKLAGALVRAYGPDVLGVVSPAAPVVSE